ncbi:uncharacterized protein SOCE26_084070 [Sorangium cellulosum]|uniref:Uncharacterized protein n=1 Tax=Sorangium cellulosum TaxID=56 RepID=A0A2L0F5U9_SORCE|nr:hypothetical protein [Sorangium cellulosum]AUX46897.1 uncharacterized protein SOCE26_084070 [Sorangium cellulosum]
MREPSTEHARLFFTSLGCEVEDIAVVEGQKRADLRVTWKEEEYVVEAKFREPHREWHAAREHARANGYATTSRDIEPWTVLSNTITKARAQLVSTPASPDAFRVLWVVALHGDDRFVIDCTEKKLVGTRLLFALRDFYEPPEAIECYYYDDNEFERCPEIDAAMLCTREGGRLFVNHHSPSRERFRSSYVYSTVNKKGAVVDAEILVKNGHALMLDVDFKNPRAGNGQWEYIKDKYGVLTSAAIESQFFGIAITSAPVVSSDTENCRRLGQLTSDAPGRMSDQHADLEVVRGKERDDET